MTFTSKVFVTSKYSLVELQFYILFAIAPNKFFDLQETIKTNCL
uniref:Uncharacterized protein n=1 Tax=Arundo donax TaxID=35708 RepID=A0A0A9A4R1_ARUDO